MSFNRFSFAIAILSLVSVLNLSSCASKDVKPSDEDKGNVSAATDTALDNTLGDSDSGKASGLQISLPRANICLERVFPI